MRNVSIVLPTYNEVNSLVPLIQGLESVFKKDGAIYPEYIVVDDGSSDGTIESIKEYMKKNRAVKLILKEQPPSLGISILRGIESATYEFLLIMDSDFNHLPSYCVKIINSTNKGHVVIGSRFAHDRTVIRKRDYRYLGSFFVQTILRYIAGLKPKDCLCGFFCIHRDDLMGIDKNYIFQGYGNYFIYLLKALQNKNIKISEMPVIYGQRMGGKSKTKLLRYVFSVWKSGWTAKNNYPRGKWF